MLSAMASGHDGSLSTVHAGSPEEALRRVETLALMADVGAAARGDPRAGRRRDRPRRPAARGERDGAAADRGGERGACASAGGPATRELFSLQGGRARWRVPLPAALAGDWRRRRRCARPTRSSASKRRGSAARVGRAVGRAGVSAAPLAALAAALGVLALWDALAAVERAARARTRSEGCSRRCCARGARARSRARPSAGGSRSSRRSCCSPPAGCVAGPIAGRGARGRRAMGAADARAPAPAPLPRRAGARGARGRAGGRRRARGRARDLPCARGGGAQRRRRGGGRAGRARARRSPSAQPLEAALATLQARAGSRAYDTLATAILLQRDAGGDLVGLLRELARAQEAAARGADDARAATAQARFTGVVVGVLPAGAAALAELASPGALAGVLRNPLALWLAVFAGFLSCSALLADPAAGTGDGVSATAPIAGAAVALAAAARRCSSRRTRESASDRGGVWAARARAAGAPRPPRRRARGLARPRRATRRRRPPARPARRAT